MVRTSLSAGTHVITGVGLDPEHPRASYFAPRFAAGRPAGDPAAEPGLAWGSWALLAAGGELPGTDPRAIRVRRPLSGRRVYGTSSVSYVAFGPAGMRYDFQPVPGDIGAVSTAA